jgi:hypothetical protein
MIERVKLGQQYQLGPGSYRAICLGDDNFPNSNHLQNIQHKLVINFINFLKWENTLSCYLELDSEFLGNLYQISNLMDIKGDKPIFHWVLYLENSY